MRAPGTAAARHNNHRAILVRVENTRRERRLRRMWDREAAGYDRSMAWAERRLFGDTRAWIAGRARGRTLEVAIGTGLNLAHYPAELDLVGVEWSAAMLALARRRARDLRRPVALHQGDAQALPYADGVFDTVVCTFALCGVPDDRRALAEMTRALRPGGVLLMADHVASTRWPIRLGQAAGELVSLPLQGEHFRRRPVRHLASLGLEVEEQERFRWGLIERVAARKPAPPR